MTKKIFVVMLVILTSTIGTSLFAMRFMVEAGGAYNSARVTVTGGGTADSEESFGIQAGVGAYDLFKMGPLQTDLMLRFIQKSWGSDWANNYIELYPKFKYPVNETIQPFVGVGVGFLISTEKFAEDNMNSLDLSLGAGVDYLIGENLVVGAAYNFSLLPAYEWKYDYGYGLKGSWEFSHNTLTISVGYLF